MGSLHIVSRWQHHFKSGDVLVRHLGEGRVTQVFVDENLSDTAIKARAIDIQGNIGKASREIAGEELAQYARDPLATRLLSENRRLRLTRHA